MKILNMFDIEDILYNGNKEEIANIIKKYKILYNYNQKSNSFEFESMKLLEKSRGYGNHEMPNCVKYFGISNK